MRVTRTQTGAVVRKAPVVEDGSDGEPETAPAPAKASAAARTPAAASARTSAAASGAKGPKTAQAELTGLYQTVVADVVLNIKTEFQAAGADESALQMLEALWRQKLEESGVMEPPVPAGGAQTQLMRQGLLQATVTGTMQSMTSGAAGGSNKRQKAADGAIVVVAGGQGVVETVPEDAERIKQLEKEELSSDEDDDNEPETAHLVLAQFDKVARTKSKWKCSLKDGILHLNGRDYSCSKGTGDFEF